MKEIPVILLILIFSVLASSQTAQEKVATLERLNAEVKANHQAGDYGDGLKAAQTALALCIEIYGEAHLETARAYSNIGELYRLQRKHGPSAENFEKAYLIYTRDPVKNAKAISVMLQSLGVVLTLDGKQEKAEGYFVQQVANAENFFGKETKETLPALRSLTSFYIHTKQHDKVDEIFLKQYLIASISRRKGDTEGLDDITDDRYCYSLQHLTGKERGSRDKAFSERVKAQDESRFGVEKVDKPETKIGGGVINGKALALPKPRYPDEAKALRIAGSVAIKVVINEEGRVISAKAICGHPAFHPETEAAARGAKFSPTSLNGVPTRVTGIITYNFVPPR